jgi:hypothetical protein
MTAANIARKEQSVRGGNKTAEAGVCDGEEEYYDDEDYGDGEGKRDGHRAGAADVVDSLSEQFSHRLQLGNTSNKSLAKGGLKQQQDTHFYGNKVDNGDGNDCHDVDALTSNLQRHHLNMRGEREDEEDHTVAAAVTATTQRGKMLLRPLPRNASVFEIVERMPSLFELMQVR